MLRHRRRHPEGVKRAALIALATLLNACAPNFSNHPSAEEVMSALDSPWIGQKGIEESFIEDGGAQDEILAGICTASPKWLQVAHRMYDTGNAHWGEEMGNALAIALTKEPKVVLATFGEGVCGEPDDELPSSCAVPHWRTAALEALKTLNDPVLDGLKQKCIVGVTRSVGLQSLQEAK